MSPVRLFFEPKRLGIKEEADLVVITYRDGKATRVEVDGHLLPGAGLAYVGTDHVSITIKTRGVTVGYQASKPKPAKKKATTRRGRR